MNAYRLNLYTNVSIVLKLRYEISLPLIRLITRVYYITDASSLLICRFRKASQNNFVQQNVNLIFERKQDVNTAAGLPICQSNDIFMKSTIIFVSAVFCQGGLYGNGVVWQFIMKRVYILGLYVIESHKVYAKEIYLVRSSCHDYGSIWANIWKHYISTDLKNTNWNVLFR